MSLTREQIDKLEEGPEADAAAAEFVMGWSKEFATTKRGPGRRQPAWVGVGGVFMHWEWEWRPTTYIAAAMEVVDVIAPHRVVSLKRVDSEWRCFFAGGACTVIRAEAPTLRLAIVKAALLWALEQEESGCTKKQA